MIYLDSAGVVKPVRSERESADLVAWLNARPNASLVSSVLVEVEVPRALRRSAPQALAGGAGAELEAFVTYDKRLLAAADALGLPTASPGAAESG